MRSVSAKPRVMTRTVGSPFRSSRALVATVVPIRTTSISSVGIGAPGATPSRWRIPATAASRYRAGSSESSLWVVSVPSGRRATTSVNVPPRSIQNCQPVMGMTLGDRRRLCCRPPTPASAAPANKGTTFVAPSALTSSVLEGVAKPGSLGARGAGFGIVGNPSDGTIEHVGGLYVYSPASDSTLELRNFTIRVADGRVSGIVNDAFRADLFSFDPADAGDGSVTLYFTGTASNAVVGSNAIAGAVAGTATIVMP